MARHLRVEYPGALYHITARGNERGVIFRTKEDRQHLLELLSEAVERYEVHLYAYLLMDNHYHLAIQTEHPNLHAFMHYLNTAYTVWANRRNERRGHLFEGRYKAIAMEKEGYLLSATGYIHLNPVRVRGWKQRPVEERLRRVGSYPWSSYGAYTRVGAKKRGPEVTCDRVWGELNARRAGEGRRRYREYIRNWLKKEEEERRKPKDKRDQTVFNPFSEVKLGCYLGGDQFRDFIQGLLMGEEELSSEVVGYKGWRKRLATQEVVREAAEVRGAAMEDILEPGKSTLERDVIIYLCREVAEKGLREIGEVFGIKTSAAGHAVRRVKRRMRGEKRFKRSVENAKESVITILQT